jgi:uncharacterized alkaline shock family protein YloU
MAQQTTTDLRPTGSDLRPTGGHSLLTGQGRTSIADSVVEKIAGVAAREVSGVHEMGRGAARAFGTIKERLPVGSGPNVTQGVSVEVGERQAAIDIDLVVDYGVSIPDVAQAVRDNVIQRIERMTGLEVTEVNISVDDVFLGDDSPPEPPRVQ